MALQASLKSLSAHLLHGSGGLVALNSITRRLASQPEALGFSPGNSGQSEEMKEVGRPHEVKDNEEAHQRHMFSEKMRFSFSEYQNPEQTGSKTAAAVAGDTGSDRAVGDLSMKLSKEDPATLTGNQPSADEPKPELPDELAPEIDRADFEERPGGEGGPGKIPRQQELKKVGVEDGGGGAETGPGAKPGAIAGGKDSHRGETGPHNYDMEKPRIDYSE